MSPQENTALLDELIEPLGRCLTPEVARKIAQLRASPQLDALVQELGQKCNEGQLTAQERADYETIARFIRFISVLQSKARALLRTNSGS